MMRVRNIHLVYIHCTTFRQSLQKARLLSVAQVDPISAQKMPATQAATTEYSIYETLISNSLCQCAKCVFSRRKTRQHIDPCITWMSEL